MPRTTTKDATKASDNETAKKATKTSTTTAIKEPVPESVPLRATRKQLDPTMEVACYNNTKGLLYYNSKRMQGYSEEWNETGEVAYIELAELRNMVRTQPRFFSEGWLRIDDPDVIADLHIEKYYKNVFFEEDIEELFQKKPDEIVKTLKGISAGSRTFVILSAREMIEKGTLTNFKLIAAIEKELDCELYERD